MKHHEREYFISRIRSGFYHFKFRGKSIKVLTPTIEDEFFINQAYKDCYEESVSRGIKTQEQMTEWLLVRGLLTEEDQSRKESFASDIEKLQIGIYQSFTDIKKREAIRMYLRAAEKGLRDCQTKNSKFFSNTCEGLSSVEKMYETMRLCSYTDGEKVDFSKISLEEVTNLCFSKILNDKTIRDLARNDPWRTIWILNESGNINLFDNKDRELSIDQKNLLIWSKTYDNTYESMDVPPDYVIEDDDMLDGWFLVQKKEREEKKMKDNVDNNLSDKIGSADEVMIMAKDRDEAHRINNMNSVQAKAIKRNRQAQIQKEGKVNQLNFRDEKLKIQNRANEQYKGKFRR